MVTRARNIFGTRSCTKIRLDLVHKYPNNKKNCVPNKSFICGT